MAFLCKSLALFNDRYEEILVLENLKVVAWASDKTGGISIIQCLIFIHSLLLFVIFCSQSFPFPFCTAIPIIRFRIYGEKRGNKKL